MHCPIFADVVPQVLSHVFAVEYAFLASINEINYEIVQLDCIF